MLLAGRKVLLQSVFTAIPQYWVGTNILQKNSAAKISSSQTTFLWMGQNDYKGWTPVAWKYVTAPRVDGGLGVRDVAT